jgi:U3 small nucleolar RNA-associated protein 14
MERGINYDTNKKHIKKFIPQVKQNREAEVIDLNKNDEKVSLNFTKNLSEQFTPSTEMEKNIKNELQKQGLIDEQSIKVRFEFC